MHLEHCEYLFDPNDILALCFLNKEDMETLSSECDPLQALKVPAPVDWDLGASLFAKISCFIVR